MAIAVNGGHVSRAIEFFKTPGKYFIIGGTQPWEDETNPPAPNIDDYKLIDVVGLKKVDNIHLVIPDENGTIQYRSQNWKIVPETISTTVGATGVSLGSTVVSVSDLAGLAEGSRVRINNVYEGVILSISGLLLTLDSPAPEEIPAHSPIISGALVERAKYVYMDCYLNYDEFPIVTYRQVGLCSRVAPDTEDILLSKNNPGINADEFSSLGVLEILDNRVPNTRDINQREMLSLIVEF